MVRARILVHRHHWYRPSHWLLLFSAYITRLCEITVGERETYYRALFEQDEYSIVLEGITDFSIFDVVPIEFSEEHMRILGDNGFLNRGGSRIKLKQLEEKGLLQSLGIYERLETIWDGICNWKTEGENNGWC